jgi:hypothetical protein
MHKYINLPIIYTTKCILHTIPTLYKQMSYISLYNNYTIINYKVGNDASIAIPHIPLDVTNELRAIFI